MLSLKLVRIIKKFSNTVYPSFFVVAECLRLKCLDNTYKSQLRYIGNLLILKTLSSEITRKIHNHTRYRKGAKFPRAKADSVKIQPG